VDAGANMQLKTSEVEEALRKAPGATVMLLQLEIPLKTANAAIRLGKKLGLSVILNPAPPTSGRKLDLRDVDIITPNEREFFELTGERDMARGTDALLRSGVNAAVVTLGKRGAYVRADSDGYVLPAPRVKAVDTTGAGDAFNGALAVALSESRPLREAVEFANAAGALTVTRREVIPALPTRREIERLLRKRAA
jgi:ribokinase